MNLVVLLKAMFSRFYLKALCYRINLSNIEFPDLKFNLKALDLVQLNQMIKLYSPEMNLKTINNLSSRLHAQSLDKVYLIIDDQENIFGFCNIAFDKNFENTTKIFVPNDLDSVYLFEDYIFKSMRNKGAHKFSIYARLKIAKESHYKTAYVIVFANNLYSRKSYEQIGFNVISIIHYFHLKRFYKTIQKKVTL